MGPRWKTILSTSLNIKVDSTSKSGIVPATAPHKIALLPTFLPKTASPTAAPNTICVKESILN